MAVHDALAEDDVDAAWPDAGWVVLDCNPRGEVLEHTLARARRDDGVRLVVVAVSAPKIIRLPADLTGVDMLFCTRDEACAWLARHGSAPDPEATDAEVAEAVRAAGARAVVLTLGADGALGLDGDGPVEVPSAPVAVVDVTGGGDALVAGTVDALLEGAGLADALRRGVRLAGLTIAVRGAVRPDLAAAAQAR
jgi:pseudouridine kinase